MVWAHNVHVMNAYYAADLQSIHLESQPGDLKPSGVFLAEWLKDGVYTIAMTSYAGSNGWDSANPIAPAAQAGLESRLHRLGKPYVFLNFRALDRSPKHPLHAPQSMRIDKYRDDTLTDLTQAFDAVFYIDRMAPATRNVAKAPE
jgi:erythromycin esterase-like protein